MENDGRGAFRYALCVRDGDLIIIKLNGGMTTITQESILNGDFKTFIHALKKLGVAGAERKAV